MIEREKAKELLTGLFSRLKQFDIEEEKVASVLGWIGDTEIGEAVYRLIDGYVSAVAFAIDNNRIDIEEYIYWYIYDNNFGECGKMARPSDLYAMKTIEFVDDLIWLIYSE